MSLRTSVLGPLARIVALILALGVPAVMAQPLVDFDPAEVKVVLTAAEFSGLAPRTAQRRAAEPGGTALDYVVFSDGMRVFVANHQYGGGTVNWGNVDLAAYIASLEGLAGLEKTLEPQATYGRPGVDGRYILFAVKEGQDTITCMSFDLMGKNDRLTGFLCLPGSAPITTADAERMADGMGVRDAMPPK
jgi:hypothetical protein